MKDYKKGKIYIIRSKQTDKVYIGSTIQRLCKRKGQHKEKYLKYLNGESNFVCSYDILKYDDWYLELLENYPCNSKEELLKREGELIQENNCINRNIAGRSYKVWYQQNREEQLKKMKIRRKQKNYIHSKPTLKSILKQKEKYNCDCGKTIQRCEKARHDKSKYHRKNVHNILNHL
jgi:predicted RNA-binding Zn-ribbon protein involved in translation (DUF1610 family)